MAEDTVLRLINGEPTVAYIEDVQHTYAIDAASVVAGDVVYQVSGVDSKVAKADADNASARPPIGVCISVPTATTAVIVHSGGIVTGMSGLTRGTTYWLSTTAGALTSTRPTTNVYVVGVALSATELLICCVPADLAGGVAGPVSSTNNAIVRWDGTTGTLLKDSGVTINASNVISGTEGVVATERGTSPTVAAGQGAYWVRNDTPSAPVFTDDTSTAYHLLNWSPVKRPCRFATTGNIANLATGAPNSVDGITPVVGNRVLVWNQTTASGNGIYVVNVVGTGANGQWARASDFDEGPNDHIEAGVETYVQEGNAWGGIRFSLATTGTITIGSTSLTFTPEGGLARTDASSTEVIAATAFTSGTFVVSSTIDMRDHSVLAVFFLATSLGSNTQVDVVVFWSDDGSTIPFATDDYLQQTDFNITAQTDGSYYPKPYTARLTTTGGELVANAGVHLSFPKRGGACRIGVKGNNASGSFAVRSQRITN